MRLQILASAALALAGSTAAFSDSWPLVMFSTSQFSDAPSTDNVQTRSQALQHAKELLSSCPTDHYILAPQEGVNAADLRLVKTMPHLHNAMKDSKVQGKFIVPEVVGGSIDVEEIKEYIKKSCAKQGKEVVPHVMSLVSLQDSQHEERNDFMWTTSQKWMEDSYTVLFVGTSSSDAEETVYEPDFIEPIHMDLKRDITDGMMRRADNGSNYDNRPLFQKYQFFTPGIFMAIVVSIVLLSILGVGLRALASLEVSYGAFDKDMGPAAQKKQ
ncbi:hypothetical protein FZEAL_989 [Fusarium zealandicum]|uniref:Protein BIG1 n=1 Tax=Fusarium zealandicum TaxID=1053134 RepID=A0A8H4XPW2_9HYPO|nr:hypothetical protein FZEAL_989 [Fusarium zealandicum]